MQQYELVNKAGAYWQDAGLDEFEHILLLPGSDEGLNDRIREAFVVKLKGSTGLTIDGETARQLVVLYSLYCFNGKVMIGSFDEPHGRKLRNLIDTGIATEEELINDVILGGING